MRLKFFHPKSFSISDNEYSCEARDAGRNVYYITTGIIEYTCKYRRVRSNNNNLKKNEKHVNGEETILKYSDLT